MITRTVTNPGARVTVRPMSGEALTTVAGASVSVRTIQEISYVSINISYVSIVPGH